jgi:hypothetical protein
MSAEEFAVADTCFLIDWAYWRRRNVLPGLFRAVFVPEEVLREVKSESTLEWVPENLATGSFALFTETQDVVGFARAIVERSRMLPIRGVDLPEAVCLAISKMRGYTVLTENRGALMAADTLAELSGVRVWRSLDLISHAFRRGILGGDPETVFMEYEEDTGHMFPREELRGVIDELRGKA